MLSFECDYNNGASPKVLEKLIETNMEYVPGYGEDKFTSSAVEKIKANFIDSNVSEEVFRSIFNEIDTNHDGEIDFGEFKDMMFGL